VNENNMKFCFSCDEYVSEWLFSDWYGEYFCTECYEEEEEDDGC
jgi:formylmethanofuran dehydrogenase subunit E